MDHQESLQVLLANTTPSGASNGGAKLTEEQAREIFTARKATGETYQSLADRFGVGHTTVANLCTGKRWKHLAGSLANEAGAAS